jgi:hypothetical protein
MERILLRFKNLLKIQIAVSAWQLFSFMGFNFSFESNNRFNFSGSALFYSPQKRELNEVIKMNYN